MFIFIISLVIIITIFYIYNYQQSIYFLDTGQLHKIKKDIIAYLSGVSTYEIQPKTGTNQSKDSLVSFYINNVLDFSTKEKQSVSIYVDYLSKHYSEFSFLTKEWTFVKLSNRLEKGMPFTLGSYIYLPSHYVDNLVYTQPHMKNDVVSIWDTLIHEKIHILQRYNPSLFHSFYKHSLGYIHAPDHVVLNDTWTTCHFKNPDGLDINWIIEYNHAYYLPLLIFTTNRNIKQIVITLDKIKDIYYTTNKYIEATTWEYFKKYPEGTTVYHPNEITAFILPKLILKTHSFGTHLTNTFRVLLNNLKSV